MKTVVAALAAATLLVAGVCSAYADQGGGPHPDTAFTELPGMIAHSPHYTRPVITNNFNRASWFMEQPGQIASPPHYARRVIDNKFDRGSWFMEQPGQIARPRF